MKVSRQGPASLTTLVRERTAGGLMLVEHAVAILVDRFAKTSDRLTALNWLGERGFGKAVGLDVLVKVDAARQAAGSLPTLDTSVLEALVSGTLVAPTPTLPDQGTGTYASDCDICVTSAHVPLDKPENDLK